MADHSAPIQLDDGGTVHFALDEEGHVVSLALEDADGERTRVEMTSDEARNLGQRLALAADMI